MQQLRIESNGDRAVGPNANLCARELLDVAPPVVRQIRRIMRGYRLADLSVPQFRAMAILSYSPKASLSCVADFIGSSLPAASRMIDGLVARKLVARTACTQDRRQVSLALTPKGLSAFRESREATQEQLAEKLSPLSAEQRQCVIDAMHFLGGLFGSDAGRLRHVPSAEANTDAPRATISIDIQQAAVLPSIETSRKKMSPRSFPEALRKRHETND